MSAYKIIITGEPKCLPFLIGSGIVWTGCGIKIRGDDPAAMKDFILSVQNRVNELKASSGDGQKNINGKRVSWFGKYLFSNFLLFLLLICRYPAL